MGSGVTNMEDRRHPLGIKSLRRLILIAPFLLAESTVAQSIVPNNDGTGTQITQNADQYNITGGQLSADGQNLFHSFHQFGLISPETANFVAPTGINNILGRVNGGQPSVINGLLQVSGSPANLYLLNPAGILFGSEATLNLSGGFFATTANAIDFQQGAFSAIGTANYTALVSEPISLQFLTETSGAIINTANLSVNQGQTLSLTGGSILNTGTLTAPEGSITLASVPNSQRVHLGTLGNILGYEFIPPQTPEISPLKLPELLTAALPVTHTGLTVNPDGSIELQSGVALTVESGTLISTGDLTVSSPSDIGGHLTLLGRHIGLLAGEVDATGSNGGGQIWIGGSRQGKGPLPNAEALYVDETVTISADAISSGQGGEIILWSDIASRIYGRLSAQGGTLQGNGGFIETSSRDFLDVTRAPLVGAAQGLAGTWLLDPFNLEITNDTDNNISAAPTFEAQGVSPVLSIATLTAALANGGNVIVSTTNPGGPFAGNITLSAPLVYTARANTSLELQAAGSIIVSSDITPTGTSAALDLILRADTDDTGDGSVVLTAGTVIETAGGNFFAQGNSENTIQPGAIILLNDSLIATDGGDVTLNGQSSTTPGVLLRGEAEIDTTNGIEDGDITINGSSGEGVGVRLRGTLDAGTEIITIIGESEANIGVVLSGNFTTISELLQISGINEDGKEIAIEATQPLIDNNITLNANGDIEVEYLDASGNIDIVTPDFFRAFGESPEGLSLLTRNGGTIEIFHGGGAVPFVIGKPDINGTEGGIATSQENFIFPTAVLFDDFIQGNIAIYAEETASINCTAPCNNVFDQTNHQSAPLPEQWQENNFLTPEQQGQAISISEESWSFQDNSFTNEYTNYLGINSENTLSLPEVQHHLHQVALETGENPAIVYANFVSTTPPTATSKNLLSYDQKQDTDVLELVMVTSQGMPLRKRIDVTRSDLDETIIQLHRAIANHAGFNATRYLNPAQKLNRWLIEPLENGLSDQDISNLSFVLPSGLRSLPLAALHDGNSFLIERYSVGMMPSIGLTDMSYTDIREGEVLAMGASIFTDQPALPAVPMELTAITETLWPGQSLLNETFTPEAIIDHREEGDYQILHLATHSEFQGGDLNNSYIQFWNGRLGLDQLRSLKLNAPPVDLLVLSSCRTALGSEEAELGFAGLAVQAGVKTAMASLWKVDDMGTAGLMTEFYDRLQESSLKAEALREAQLAMINGEVNVEAGYLTWSGGQLPLPTEFTEAHQESFSHPYYWAAFTLIGNPW